MQEVSIPSIFTFALSVHLLLWTLSRWTAQPAIEVPAPEYEQSLTTSSELGQVLASQRDLVGLCKRAVAGSAGWSSAWLVVASLSGFVCGAFASGYLVLRFARGSVAVAHATVQHGDVHTSVESPPPSVSGSVASSPVGALEDLVPVHRRRGVVLQ